MSNNRRFIKFINNPNFVYKETIFKGNDFRGCKFVGNLGGNDIFDIYHPFNDKNKNKIYLILKSLDDNSNINIMDIESGEIKHRLCNGHINNKCISMIRHFENFKIKKNYLLSSSDSEIILWDLNKFDIIYNIKSEFNQTSYSSLLLFNNFNISFPNLIITSYYKGTNKTNFIKIYNFYNGALIKGLPSLDSYSCYYLLSWNKYENGIYKTTYLIACCDKQIIIYDIYNDNVKDNIYAKFMTEKNSLVDYYSCCLVNKKKNNKEIMNDSNLLYSSTNIGKIIIWDLDLKININIIDSDLDDLYKIINFNEKYLISCSQYSSIIIIDVNQNKIVTNIKTKEYFGIVSIKKLFHPKYKESFLTCGRNDSIKLWSLI